MASPTARSLEHMRKLGFMAQVTEKWNQYSRTRQDLFGCIDILAISNGETVGIQSTVTGSVSARLAKMRDSSPKGALKGASGWLACPNRRLVIQGWAKRGERGKRKVWTLKEIEVTLAMLVAE